MNDNQIGSNKEEVLFSKKRAKQQTQFNCIYNNINSYRDGKYHWIYDITKKTLMLNI